MVTTQRIGQSAAKTPIIEVFQWGKVQRLDGGRSRKLKVQSKIHCSRSHSQQLPKKKSKLQLQIFGVGNAPVSGVAHVKSLQYAGVGGALSSPVGAGVIVRVRSPLDYELPVAEVPRLIFRVSSE